MTSICVLTAAAALADATPGMPAGGLTVTVLINEPLLRLVVPSMRSVIVAPAGNVATVIPAPCNAAMVNGAGHVAPPVVPVHATALAV